MEFKKPIYPIEQWNITETEFKKENNYRNETTFALSNGYIGTRGTFEEAYPFDVDTGLEGNFVNGFYESNEIRYGEANFGSPLLSQSLLNLPNLKEIHVILDGEEFTMEQGEVKEYARTLHMKDGILERKLTWTASSGKMTEIHIFRLVSFARKNIMAIRYQVRPVNYAGTVEFVSKMQADVENHTRKTNPIVDYGPFGRRLDPDKVKAENDISYYEGTTKGSHLTVACGSVHELWCDGQTVTDVNWMAEAGEMDTVSRVSLSAKEGECVTLDKFICYSTSLDMEKEKLEAFVQDELAAAKSEGYEKLKEQQKSYMQDFWKTADVEIKGNEELQQGLHFNLFHIIQSAGRDGKTGMGAKGLSGEGYEGHYFWDTEMYVLPVLIFTEPETARKLLDYRYATLPQARDRARILGHMKGALYPWRTINGEEASTYYPLGTAQYHINADISYALSLYLQVTGDVDYLKEKGAEILIETARVWADVGSFAECKGGKYCICDVTGPDEYNVLVDNNFYTNFSATLTPMDSKGYPGSNQTFDRPRVTFGADADYLLPILSLNKATPKLNTRDHFAYVQGYPDGTVKPTGSITRAEVAAILFRLMDADSRSLYYSTASGFRDVDSTKWYNTYVATLNNAGVITDSRTGYFRPNDAITRAELAAMLAQFAEKKSAAIYFSDVSAGYWAANAIALTANLGWINGYPDGTFGPDKTVTRAELMAMVNRATGRAPESTGALLSGMKTWKDNADTARWYYLDVQEATNSHTYLGAPTETWTSLTATPDWSQYE